MALNKRDKRTLTTIYGLTLAVTLSVWGWSTAATASCESQLGAQMQPSGQCVKVQEVVGTGTIVISSMDK